VAGGPSDLSHTGCPGSPNPLPQNTGAPSIQGSAVEGQTLTEVGASWSNGPLSSFAYQWARCDGSGANCVAIPGATAVSYAVGSADVGATLKVSEMARNGVGWSSPAWSNPTSQVTSSVPANVALPVVVGSDVAGQTLSVQRGVWANAPTMFQYQWLRCNGAGANCQPLAGQTGLTYGLTGQDVGSTLKVQEVAVNAWGASAPAVSTASGSVADASLTVQAFALVGTVGGIVPGPVASFSQPGAPNSTPGTYSATVSWGDGTSRPAEVIAGRAGSYLVNASHAYTRPGDYSLTVRVTAATGAAAQSTNRVSVFAAAVCPKGSAARGHNCLGQISLPAGCLAPGSKLHVSIPSPHGIRRVSYSIDNRGKAIGGSGSRFAAALPTDGLASGGHSLTARITFRSGHPPMLAKTRQFAIC
jgi:PKD domain